MTDLQQAIHILHRDSHTCVLVKGDSVITSDQSGISPMLDFLLEHRDLRDYAAADKIIGKAAAMLFALAGVRQLYGDVVSQTALDFGSRHDMTIAYQVLTEQIRNRQNDGPCPMEETAGDLEDPQEAFRSLLEKREKLRQNHHTTCSSEPVSQP